MYPSRDRRRWRRRSPRRRTPFVHGVTCPRPSGVRSSSAWASSGRAQGGRRRAGHDRGREDPLGVTRRGAGGHRHLRLRRRAVAPARRAHDALRAAGAQADGDVAPAGRGRRHHRVQLPVRGVGLERRGRLRLRGHHRVEALADDPAHLDGVPGPGGARRVGVRCAGRGAAARDRRRSVGPGCSWTAPMSRSSARRDRSAWGRRSRHAWRPAWGSTCSSSAGTTPRSWRRRPISSSPGGESSSPQREPPASAARPCVG